MRRISFLMLAFTMLLSACGEDDEVINQPPVIQNQSFNTSEAIDDQTVIGTVQANDPEGETLTFSISVNSASLFEINDSGELSLQTGQSLDFETAASHELTVVVSDGNESVSALITVTVIDQNENVTPTISDQTFEVAENISTTDEIGTVVAADSDGDAFTFSITEDADDLFEITDGGVISLQEDRSLDFENQTSHTITVQVSDGVLSASATITINVTDVQENAAPVIADQSFTVSESITGFDEIGILNATDAEGGELRFFLTGDVPEFFRVATDGTITLTNNDIILDFETTSSHTFEVVVLDAENASATATVTINVTDDVDAFITKWRVTASDRIVQIPVRQELSYNFNVDWGDGTTSENITTTNFILHQYAETGSYTVRITGTFPAIYLGQTGGGFTNERREQLVEINQWGDMAWSTMAEAFQNAKQLAMKAIDAPDLSAVTDMTRMFFSTSITDGQFSNWNVNNVTDMTQTFGAAELFVGDISNWDVSNVTSMQSMFDGATNFNGDLSGWNVNDVVFMSRMFANAVSFNQNIGNWRVGDVQSMREMFRGATSFNQNIGGWNLPASLVSIGAMFRDATSFNQDLSNWNVTSITDMSQTFDGASAFNQDLSSWNTINVTGCFAFARGTQIEGDAGKLPSIGPCF